MSKLKNHEEIKGLFQSWPESFSLRWKRNVSKDELYDLLDQKLQEAQTKEIEDKFFDWSPESIEAAWTFLEDNKIDFIDEPKTKEQKFSLLNNNKAKK